MSNFLVILSNNIDQTQRNQIHAVVKRDAHSWWHEHLDTWIIKSEQEAVEWQEKISILFEGLPDSSFLILTLQNKPEDSNDWGGSVSTSTARWIQDILKAGNSQTFMGRYKDSDEKWQPAQLPSGNSRTNKIE